MYHQKVKSVPEDDTGSKDHGLLLSPIVFGPDSPRLILSPLQQGTRHAPAMNATLHHSASGGTSPEVSAAHPGLLS